jgi:NAD(P)-dependent dehydrogenase (short-subunit alcohol dehydrogenase family)
MSLDRRDSPAAPDGGASYPSLRGRRVFITGGGSGIGGCMTEAFARQGALVAFVDISEAHSQELIRKIEQAGFPRPWYRKTDVTDVAALQTAIRDAASLMGDFHVLINNVASDDRHSLMEVTPSTTTRHRGQPAPAISRSDRGAWHEWAADDHQLRFEFYGARAALSVYTTAKSSVIGLTRGPRRNSRTRIRINVITPG